MGNPFLVALLERGVWQAPWLGPDGELVLIAITRARSMYGLPFVVPHGASRIEAAERMMGELDAVDAVPNLQLISGGLRLSRG